MMDQIDKSIEGVINNNFKFYFLFCLVASFTFNSIILSPTLVDIDFDYVFIPIKNLPSLTAYWNHDIYTIDLQPVRDLFIMFMFKINSIIGHQSFGFFNFILWLSSVLILEKILNRVTSRTMARLVSLVVLVHPIAAWTLYWPTAVKHLLALFFITCASYYAFKFKEEKGGKGTGFKLFLFYFLAVNSQPIILCFPIVLLLFLSKDLRQKYPWPTLIFCFLVMFFYTWSNYIYYRDVYPLFVKSTKIDPFNLENLMINLFGLSRSLSQIMIPIQFALNYSFSSILNFVGLPLFSFLAIFWSKKFDCKTLFFYLCLIFYPLVTIYGQRTNIFVSDTYLLVSLLSMSIFFVVYLFNTYQFKKLLILMVLCLGFKSHYESTLVIKEESIFRKSYLREPECKNAFAYSSYLLYDTKIEEFKKMIHTALANHCLLVGGGAGVLTSELYSFLIFYNDNTPLKKKIELISSAKNKTPIVHFILDSLKLKARLLTVRSPDFKNIQESQIVPSRRKLFHLIKKEL